MFTKVKLGSCLKEVQPEEIGIPGDREHRRGKQVQGESEESDQG